MKDETYFATVDSSDPDHSYSFHLDLCASHQVVREAARIDRGLSLPHGAGRLDLLSEECSYAFCAGLSHQPLGAADDCSRPALCAEHRQKCAGLLIIKNKSGSEVQIRISDPCFFLVFLGQHINSGSWVSFAYT